MSETDPWAKVRTFDVSTYGDCRMEQDYYGEIASEQKYQRGEYAWVDEVDAARAAEAAQHQQEIAAKDETIAQLEENIARQAGYMLAADARLAAVEEERDAFKAENGEVLERSVNALKARASTPSPDGQTWCFSEAELRLLVEGVGRLPSFTPERRALQDSLTERLSRALLPSPPTPEGTK